MRKETVIRADYTEIESLIQRFYNIKEYCIPAMEEVGNDTSLSFKVTPVELDSDVIVGESKWRTKDILDDLCFRGRLEPGEYVVDVSW